MSKQEKEQAVFGHEGASLVDIYLQVSLFPLLISISQNSQSSLFRDLLVLAFPLLLFHTVVTDLFPFGIYGYFVLVAFFALFPSRARQPSASSPLHHQGISLVRATTVLSTIICILAVDFPLVFPRKYCKTEWYGTGLMDVGVGAYIFTGALTHKFKKPNKQSFFPHWTLFLLGVIRPLVVHLLNYQVHMGEYGAHWNFFLTLAFARSIADGLPPWVGILVALAHQSLLSFTEVKEWIFQSPSAGSLLWENKEGVLSLPGYVALELCCRWLGNHMLQASDGWFGAGFGATMVFMLCSIEWIEPISRRSCNLSYMLWILSIGMLLLGWQRLLRLDTTSVLVKVLTQNQLVVFLLANVFTGAVNFTVDTLHIPAFPALGILMMYLFLVTFLAQAFRSTTYRNKI